MYQDIKKTNQNLTSSKWDHTLKLMGSSSLTRDWLEKIKKDDKLNSNIKCRDVKWHTIFTIDTKDGRGIAQLNLQKRKIRMFVSIPVDKIKAVETICGVIGRLTIQPEYWSYSKQYQTRFYIESEEDVVTAICLMNIAHDIYKNPLILNRLD